jgi:hypothetical protein
MLRWTSLPTSGDLPWSPQEHRSVRYRLAGTWSGGPWTDGWRMENGVAQIDVTEQSDHLDALEMVGRVRKVGVRAIAGDRELRHAAASLLEVSDELLRPALTRLAAAGTRPSYWQYTMSGALVERIGADPTDAVKRCSRVVDALLADLHDRAVRGEFTPEDEAALTDAIHRCRLVAQHVSFGYDLAPILGDDELDALLLPESGVPGEIVFLRVLQCGDVLFEVGNALARESVKRIKLGRWDLLRAHHDLGWLLAILTMLSQLLDVLSAGLTKQDWHLMRDFVEEPSVIQALAYSGLVEALAEAGRLLPYPRVVGSGPCVADYESFASDVRTVIDRAQALLEEWFKKHLGVAKAFNRVTSDERAKRYLSPGTPMLAEQRPKYDTTEATASA